MKIREIDTLRRALVARVSEAHPGDVPAAFPGALRLPGLHKPGYFPRFARCAAARASSAHGRITSAESIADSGTDQ